MNLQFLKKFKEEHLYIKNFFLFRKLIYLFSTFCLILVVNQLTLWFKEAPVQGKIALVVFFVLMISLYLVLRKIYFAAPRHFFKKANVSASVQTVINNAIGPAPWYWQTFPTIKGASKHHYVWTFHGTNGRHSFLVTLSRQNEPQNFILALNAYTRAFAVSPHYLGLWFSKKDQIQLLCFDPDKMPVFHLEDLPANFRNSKEPYYSLANPVSSILVPGTLQEGLHHFRFPKEFETLDEILLAVPYPEENAAYAIFEIRPAFGTVNVMPQKWFTKKNFDLGYEWITRVARDPATGKLYGDGTRIGIFELSSDGCDLERWVGVS